MKRSHKIWLWVVILVDFILLMAFMIIFPIILKWSWWWFSTPLIVSLTGWLIFIIIIIIKKLTKVPKELAKISVSGAVEFHRNRLLEDDDIGDNVILVERELGRYGGEGKEPTPVLLIEWDTTESNKKIFTITNLNNYKEEFTDKTNPKPSEIEKLKRIISENPPTESYEDIERLDAFGRTMEKVRRPIPSAQRHRDEIENKKIEEANSI